MRRFLAREIVINYHQNLEMDLKMINKILDSNGRDALIASIGLKTSTAGAGVGVLGWLTSQEGMTFVGVSVAVAGFLVNSFFRWRERGSDSKWFCSEAIADCLGYRDAWRFDPNTLFVVLRRANDFNNKKVGE